MAKDKKDKFNEDQKLDDVAAGAPAADKAAKAEALKADKAAKAEEAPAQPLVWKWVLDINFGQHKVGDLYEGKDHEALAAKGWIAQK